MKKWIYLSSSLSMVFASAMITTSAMMNVNNYSSSIKKEQTTTNSDVVDNGVVPLDYYGKTAILTQKIGPIVSYGDEISAIDWYGAKIWTVDLRKEENQKYLPGGKYDESKLIKYTNRTFINWALDSKNNKLWLLTNSFYKNSTNGGSPIVGPQNIIEIDSLTGKIIKSVELSSFTPANDWQLFYQIQVLSNGNIQVYGQGNANWGYNILYDINTGTQTYKNVKNETVENWIKNSLKEQQGVEVKGEIRMYYLIPITTGVNIAVFIDFNATHKENIGTGNLLFVLVDDNLTKIDITDTSSPWYKGVLVKINIDDPLGNKTDNFSKSIYTRLDGRIYFTVWNDFFLFDNKYESGYGIKFSKYSFDGNKRVLSYTMDVNENLFVKFWDDTKIYKLNVNLNSNNVQNTSYAMSTYYDISSSQISAIKDNADKFVLYNVTGYSGSIMLLSSRIVENGTYLNNNTSDSEYKNYGIAVAITPNPNDNNSGDVKGLLNTSESFQKSSDFTISEDIIKSKLPSEITRNDVTLLNGGFFTSNTTKENGTLKYQPFTLENINDENGTFDVSVYLDQIPWFTTTLPSDSIPKKITKSFSGAQIITNKISWKDNSSLTYDFKNTIPSKVTTDDLNTLDPFQVSFNSRTVLDSSGKQIYPSKSYKVSSHNDSSGELTVQVTYTYMPLNTTSTQPLTYTATKTYTTFKSTETKQFYFAGATSAATNISKESIDINTIPQLKSLSESNLLPSSFNASDSDSFLQFVNTNNSKGYPISKMNFDVVTDDANGTLKIIAKVDKSYDSTEPTFVQVFSGFNKKSSYKFSFNTSVTTIDNQQFSSILASSVNEGDVINYLVTYEGFNSSDFSITLYPDDDKGELLVRINLDNSYVSELGNSNGFKNYEASYTFTGFMTNDDYNSQYNIEFVSDEDSSLIDLKKMTLQSIEEGIKKQSLKVGNETYTSLNQLVEKLFVKSKGSKVPTNWNSETNKSKITTNMTYDNQAGTMNITISIDKSLLNGYESNLDYVISYSGFSKGNVVVTNDNLTFVSNNLLKEYVTDIQGMSASQVKDWLESNQNVNIKKLLFNVTGEYVTKIDNGQFKLEIDVNDSYNTISITITFDNLTNASSLKEYSIQYKL